MISVRRCISPVRRRKFHLLASMFHLPGRKSGLPGRKSDLRGRMFSLRGRIGDLMGCTEWVQCRGFSKPRCSSIHVGWALAHPCFDPRRGKWWASAHPTKLTGRCGLLRRGQRGFRRSCMGATRGFCTARATQDRRTAHRARASVVRVPTRESRAPCSRKSPVA